MFSKKTPADKKLSEMGTFKERIQAYNELERTDIAMRIIRTDLDKMNVHKIDDNYYDSNIKREALRVYKYNQAPLIVKEAKLTYGNSYDKEGSFLMPPRGLTDMEIDELNDKATDPKRKTQIMEKIHIFEVAEFEKKSNKPQNNKERRKSLEKGIKDRFKTISEEAKVRGRNKTRDIDDGIDF